MILMKIQIHNIYITHKILYKSGVDLSSRSQEKNFNLKYL